jgi:hypothetical protein
MRLWEIHHLQDECGGCGVAVLGDAEMDEAMRATVAAYQTAHRLLTADEVRAARSRLKWSRNGWPNAAAWAAPRSSVAIWCA